MSEMSDFQKSFLAKGTGNRLFTQEEFDDALQTAQAEIVAMAITATREAIRIEREACAKIAEDWAGSMAGEPEMLEIAKEIRNRVQEKVE